jgi:hypothetical protein
MGPNRKSPMSPNYVYGREIRPKQIMVDHNLGTPPLKKIKTEPSIGNGQNGMTSLVCGVNLYVRYCLL